MFAYGASGYSIVRAFYPIPADSGIIELYLIIVDVLLSLNRSRELESEGQGSLRAGLEITTG